MTAKQKIVKIIMERDGLSREEANDLVEGTILDIRDLISQGEDLESIEDVFMDNLGLEPDYLLELMI